MTNRTIWNWKECAHTNLPWFTPVKFTFTNFQKWSWLQRKLIQQSIYQKCRTVRTSSSSILLCSSCLEWIKKKEVFGFSFKIFTAPWLLLIFYELFFFFFFLLVFFGSFNLFSADLWVSQTIHLPKSAEAIFDWTARSIDKQDRLQQLFFFFFILVSCRCYYQN